jgi:photosystem II stability/assembly factor-like uncharacterized protein
MRGAHAIRIAFCFIALLPLESAGAAEPKEGPFVIHRIAIDPKNPQAVYAATSNYGILKSGDGGTTWALINQGLGSYTHHAVTIDPSDSKILYVGAWGGGVSKSVDRGMHWTDQNSKLGNTAIEDLVLDPAHPETIYAATTAGVYRSPDGGAGWVFYGEGLPIARIEIVERLIDLPSGPIELLLGTSRGLYKRERKAEKWEAVGGAVEKEHITAFAWDPKTGSVFMGTVKNGFLRSRDGGEHWTALGRGLKNIWISDIVIDPRHSGTIYIATRGNGVMKSRNGGATWKKADDGLPIQDIRSLAIDPDHSEILYAGTTHHGVVKTVDGGKRWDVLTGFPVLSIAEILASLSPALEPPKSSSGPTVPVEFFKCNRCHGWTDPRLNSKKTYWRVPANQRDWGLTVARMSQRAHLTPEDFKKITDFLTRYTMVK